MNARVMVRKALSILSLMAVLVGVGVVMSLPARAETLGTAETSVSIENATFTWGVNPESSGGAYFGGCNFLSAGVAGDAGGAKVWSAAQGLFSSTDENVEILKPSSDGSLIPLTWSNKCQNRYGTAIGNRTAGLDFSVGGGNPGVQPTYTEAVVQYSNGTGWVDPESNSAHIEWSGSFSIVYYGGMTYWSVTNPVLDVQGGQGTLSGTASGFGADMDDPSVWNQLPTQEIVLAEFGGVSMDGTSLELSPNYLGVSIPEDVSGRNPQAQRTAENESWWGSFPESWLRFNELTGQNSYWYTTDGNSASIQPRKVPSTIYFEWSGAPSLRVAPSSAASGSTVALSGRNLEPGVEYAVKLLDGAGAEAASMPVNADDAGVLSAELTLPEGLAVGEYRVVLVLDDTEVASVVLNVGVLPAVPVITDVSSVTTSSADLSWLPPENAESASLSGYGIEVTDRKTGNVEYSAETIELSTSVTGLQPSTMYDVSVVGIGAYGTGTAATVTVRTADVVPTPEVPSVDPNNEADLTDVVLRWGMNQESNSKSFWGACNFLSAGKAGDNGGAKPWSQELYSASDGNVRIEKPDSSGKWVAASWTTRCLDANGEPVTLQPITSNTQSEVVIDAGVGERAADGSLTIQWRGSWTVAYYDGLTYWSVTDPKLTLDSAGNGTLTAIASGFGANMDDLSKWTTLEEREIVLADLQGVDLQDASSAGGFTHLPQYLGVEVSSAGGRSSQAAKTEANASYWGSFPQSFVDYQVLTGQSSYWYTSDGQRDRAKPALPLTVAFSDSFTVPVPGAVQTGTSGTTGSRALTSGLAKSAANSAAKKSNSKTASGEATNGSAIADFDTQAVGVASSTAPKNSQPGNVTTGAGILVASCGGLGWLAWALRRRLGLDPVAALDV